MDTLQEILDTMQVPTARKTDLRWLLRNLGIQNRQHPRFVEAIIIIRQLMRDDFVPR